MKAFISKSILWATVLSTPAWLHAGDKNTAQKFESKVVDSGSFGIYVNGKRIGTETFKIEQHPDIHVATAEIRVDDGTVKAVQSAEMQVTPQGDLHSYVWRASAPTKEEASVVPSDQRLIEHIVPANMKKTDVPHALTAATAILDDNFFSQREVLLWRYLATDCILKDGGLTCGASNFVALVPRQHTYLTVTMSIVGTDKLTVKGNMREFTTFALQMGDPKQLIVMNGKKEAAPRQWLLWVDDQYKVFKIAVPDSNVEVIRD